MLIKPCKKSCTLLWQQRRLLQLLAQLQELLLWSGLDCNASALLQDSHRFARLVESHSEAEGSLRDGVSMQSRHIIYLLVFVFCFPFCHLSHAFLLHELSMLLG